MFLFIRILAFFFLSTSSRERDGYSTVTYSLTRRVRIDRSVEFQFQRTPRVPRVLGYLCYHRRRSMPLCTRSRWPVFRNSPITRVIVARLDRIRIMPLSDRLGSCDTRRSIIANTKKEIVVFYRPFSPPVLSFARFVSAAVVFAVAQEVVIDEKYLMSIARRLYFRSTDFSMKLMKMFFRRYN